jgi:hypothetical protein
VTGNIPQTTSSMTFEHEMRRPNRWKFRARGFHRRDRLTVRVAGAVGSYLVVSRSVISPTSLTGAAAFIAGRKRSEIRDEWESHLAGEAGQGLARNLQVRAAWGFLWSAVRYRLRDAAGLAWRPVDAVLKSRGLSSVVVWVPTLGFAVAIVRHDGFYGLVTYDTNLIELSGGIYLVLKTGRWWRKAAPKPRPGRVDE